MFHIEIIVFERRIIELKLAEKLWEIRTARLSGAKGHTIEEVRYILKKTIDDCQKDNDWLINQI